MIFSFQYLKIIETLFLDSISFQLTQCQVLILMTVLLWIQILSQFVKVINCEEWMITL